PSLPVAFLMARSILSLGMDCERALLTASRSRALKAGSGTPSLAATVISRASLEKILERTASLLPLRCMTFLACEWPAIRSPPVDVNAVAPYSGQTPGNKVTPARLEVGKRLGKHPTMTNGRDAQREPRLRIRLDSHAAERGLPLGRREAVLWHPGEEAVQRLLGIHADDGVEVAAHAGIGHQLGATAKDAVIGRRNVRVGADDEADAAVEEVPHGLNLRGRLGVKVHQHRIGLLAEWAGRDRRLRGPKRIVDRVH